MKCPHAALIVTNPQVCNHPDLFEPRPTVSPFYMEGIEFHTASLVLKALEYNPLKQVNFGYLNLCIADIEKTVTSYAAYRTQSLQTPTQMIIEIDSYPEPTRRLVPQVKPRRISMSGYPVAPLTGVKTDISNSVHPSGQHMPAIPPPPYSAHQQHRMPGTYTPGSLPYGAPPGWSQDLPGYPPRPGYMGSVPGRLPPGTPDGQQVHGYSTRHSASGSYPPSRLLMPGYGREMPPPPPYPGHGAGYDTHRQHMAATHPPWSASVPNTAGAVPESRQLVPGSTSLPAMQARAPVGQTVQDGVANRLSPKPMSVSPTKRIALESKPSVPVPAVSQPSKDSPFYMVCMNVKL